MAMLFTEKKTAEQIVQEAIDNYCVNEVYDLLHIIIMDSFKFLKDKSMELDAERELVKKFADLDKLEVIKTILEEEK